MPSALALGYFLHRDLPVLPMIAFDLNKMSDTDCRTRFRFDHDDLKRLVVLMQIPEDFAVLVESHARLVHSEDETRPRVRQSSALVAELGVESSCWRF
ncbi:hypothetical protein F443_06916 [Phytophthora nicotianae P1569]|uniref:Uncharacterized protein n=1 Tax=Phytophthora nicotianae P1569 TaxID=1317065 RepID=V9FCJ4_PHYNI|nr:hypothetical protein F443_06916 [Phytophthora nicotianae P1569]